MSLENAGEKRGLFRGDTGVEKIPEAILEQKGGEQHDVSRQRASELWREFSIYIGPYIQFRGQRFLNERNSGHRRIS